MENTNGSKHLVLVVATALLAGGIGLLLLASPIEPEWTKVRRRKRPLRLPARKCDGA